MSAHPHASPLRSPLHNKGTAFTNEERTALGLHGLLPPAVETLETQIARAYATYVTLGTPIEKHRFLRALQDRQEILFCALVSAHLEEMMPVVYTPTVGEAIQRYSTLYEQPRGLTVSTETIARAREIVGNHPADDVRLVVATDSSAILGIGDQGYGGIAISIGKLALYAVGGLSPFQTVPIGLDVGTDREDLRADPLYLGVRHARLRGAEYRAFIDAFVDAVKARWPRAIIQWEDLAKDAAFEVLERHRATVPSFNDDVQGTGAVALAGLLSACRMKGEALRDQRVVIHGAGAGGIGVALAIEAGMEREGLTAEEARARIFVTDSKGLLTSDRPMESYKRPFAQAPHASRPTTLGDTVRAASATVLIGLSGQARAFDQGVVTEMLEVTPRPIVFALSNPNASCEADPADLLAWTQGRAIVATGSPFGPSIGQGNNAFVFPGLGLGAVIAEARAVTSGMVLDAAYALARFSEAGWPDRVYPPIHALRDAAFAVATSVVARAIDDRVARIDPRSPDAIDALVRARFWHPRY
jgi:malate dehydrogenase (oxaloacetate-decarboxylating)